MANWLSLQKLREWDYPAWALFQYDTVTDAQITKALADPRVAEVDTALDWEDDTWLARNPDIQDDEKHAYRVAAIVRQLTTDAPLREPVMLDTYSVASCGCCITNGHHRLRALEYIGMPAAPFALAGDLDALEDLVRLAGVQPVNEWQLHFEAHFWVPAEDDVTV